MRKPLLEQTEEDWRGVIDADLTAGWRLAREAARLMIAARYGRIVFISSIMGLVARPGITAYVAAKTGLARAGARARGRARAARHHRQRARAGLLPDRRQQRAARRATPASKARISARTPTGRWGDPHELGAAALYLASPAAGYTTGTVLTVDGGMTASI